MGALDPAARGDGTEGDGTGVEILSDSSSGEIGLPEVGGGAVPELCAGFKGEFKLDLINEFSCS